MSDYSEEDREWEERWRNAAALAGARRHLDSRISDLEARIARLEPSAGQLGHNRPPETLDDIPIVRADIEELKATLAVIRAEMAGPSPRIEPLEAANSRLKSFAKKVGEWSGARGTKFADAVMDAGGKVGGAAFGIALAGLLPTLHEVTEAVEQFVRLLGLS